VGTSPDDRAAYFGRAIAARRSMLGMSRNDLVAASGVSYPYLAAIEKGDRIPSSRIMGSLAEALNCTVADLMVMSESVPDASQKPRSSWTTIADVRPFSDDSTVAMTLPPDGNEADVIDELRQEISLLRRRVDRLDSEVRDLRHQVRFRNID